MSALVSTNSPETKIIHRTTTDSYNSTVNKAVNLSGLGDISLNLGTGPGFGKGTGFNLATVEKFLPVVILGLVGFAYFRFRK